MIETLGSAQLLAANEIIEKLCIQHHFPNLINFLPVGE